jgi:hypothetical protein
MAVAVSFGGLDQLLDLGRRAVFALAIFGVRLALNLLLASMQAGDPNITTVQNQITALS